MRIVKCASAGTIESSDVYIEVEPFENGLDIDVDSVVIKQFGEKINNVIRDVFNEHGVENALVRIKDKGALECVIRARLETAIMRAKED